MRVLVTGANGFVGRRLLRPGERAHLHRGQPARLFRAGDL